MNNGSIGETNGASRASQFLKTNIVWHKVKNVINYITGILFKSNSEKLLGL